MHSTTGPPYDPYSTTGRAAEVFSPEVVHLLRDVLDLLRLQPIPPPTGWQDLLADLTVIRRAVVQTAIDSAAIADNTSRTVDALTSIDTHLVAQLDLSSRTLDALTSIDGRLELSNTKLTAIQTAVESADTTLTTIETTVTTIEASTTAIEASIAVIEPLIVTIDAATAAAEVTLVEMAATLDEIAPVVTAMGVGVAGIFAQSTIFQGEWTLFYSAAVGTGIVLPGSGINVELVSVGHTAPTDLAAIDFRSVNGTTPLHVTVDNDSTTPIQISGVVEVEGIQLRTFGGELKDLNVLNDVGLPNRLAAQTLAGSLTTVDNLTTRPIPTTVQGDVHTINGTTSFHTTIDNASLPVAFTGDVHVVNGTTPLHTTIDNTTESVTVTGDVRVINGSSTFAAVTSGFVPSALTALKTGLTNSSGYFATDLGAIDATAQANLFTALTNVPVLIAGATNTLPVQLKGLDSAAATQLKTGLTNSSGQYPTDLQAVDPTARTNLFTGLTNLPVAISNVPHVMVDGTVAIAAALPINTNVQEWGGSPVSVRNNDGVNCVPVAVAGIRLPLDSTGAYQSIGSYDEPLTSAWSLRTHSNIV